AVYQYLVDKYVGKDDILGDRFPGKHLHGQKNSDVSVFTDEYYDTPSLALFANKNSVRHRTRVNTTNPEDRKSGRQLVQVKVTPPGQFTLRNELKYEVSNDARPAKQTGEKHPLIRLISKKLRADFEKVFAEAGLDARSLHHIFTIVQTRRRGYLNWDDKNILSFSVDQGSASILWGKGTFSSVDLGLVEIAYTEATEQRREEMWNVRDAILADLVRQFPALVQTTDSKYSIVLTQLVDQVPALPLLLRTGLSAGETLGLAGLGLVLALLVIVALVRLSKENPRRTLARPEHFQSGHRRA
ncbi:MAG TPA: hypothetical protein VM509_12610, partial [Planctomycetota bacterium]|nr:hypothetical protein [Planctomycetota bacterium]